MEIIPRIGQCTVAFVIILLTFLFHKNRYKKRKISTFWYILLYLISTISLIAVNQIGNPYVNSIYLYFLINAICFIAYESKISKIWLYNLLLWFVFAFSDIVTSIIWSVFTGNTIEETFSNDILAICSNIMNITFMLVAYRIYLVFDNKIQIQSIQFKTGIFIITMTFFQTWTSVTYIKNAASKSNSIYVIVILTGFLLIDLFLAYVVSEASQALQYKYELDLIKQLQKLQLESYKETEQKYRESRAIIHDIKKHLDVAEELWGTDKSKAREYREHIDKQMDKIFCGFHCSNRILGIIMDQKMSIAQANGIMWMLLLMK